MLKDHLPLFSIMAALFVCGLLFLTQFIPGPTYVNQAVTAPAESVDVVAATKVPEPASVDTRPVVQHVPLPEAVRAIYMSACVAGTPDFRQDLVDLILETELNAVMIDIKDYSGTVAFPPATTSSWYSAWQDAECGARDMQTFISQLHELGIFVIGRITVFQDPRYAPANPDQAVLRLDGETVWRDHKGLAFVDVASRQYWDEVIDLSVQSYNIGFDELNFDYVRYPSDGNMQDIYFPQSMAGQYGADKQANLEAFFDYLHTELSDPDQFSAVRHTNTGRTEAIPWTSADLFGMTTSNTDDLSIGQIQERAVPYFDFIAPMVYPSHYTDSFLGGRNPNEYPYDVVYKAMSEGVARLAATTTTIMAFAHEPLMSVNASGTSVATGLYTKTAGTPAVYRTWIQDFDYGGEYTAADVRAQIQASYDAGVDSWMIWAPSNRYTRAALLPTS